MFQAELFDRGFLDHVGTNKFSAYIGSVTCSYNISTEVVNEEMVTQCLSEKSFEAEFGTCVCSTMSYTAKVLPPMSAYFILFLRNFWGICTLVFKAPWFHFCVLLELLFRLFTESSTPRNKASRFQLSVKLRVAIGMHQVKRLSHVGLRRLQKSPAPLHSLESIGGFHSHCQFLNKRKWHL